MSDNAADASLRDELSPGEHLLWAGRPERSVGISDAWGMLRGLFSWATFVIVAAFVFYGSDFGFGALSLGSLPLRSMLGSLFYSPIGVLLVLLLLYNVFGRLLIEVARRRRTFYGVTPDRIMIFSGLFGPSTQSLDLRSLSDVRLDEEDDGCGTITFGRPEVRRRPWWNDDRSSPPAEFPGFERIPHVRGVYEMIRDAQRRASER